MPPGIANVSNDQVVCEGSLVTLSCSATGRPTPTITWTKVEDNGTDSAPLLPVVDRKYVLSNIQRSANGTYRCTVIFAKTGCWQKIVAQRTLAPVMGQRFTYNVHCYSFKIFLRF